MSAIQTPDLSSTVQQRRRPPVILATAICYVIAFVLVYGSFGLNRRFNVDENVFLASGYLVGRRGLMLYRDFHYNHMPTLVLIYALIFRHTSNFLLAARTFSSLNAAGCVAAIYSVAYRRFKFLDATHHFLITAALALTLLCNPLFTRTAGLSWNHDFPMFCSLLGFLILGGAFPDSTESESRSSLWLAIASGFFVGLAVTTRLTFATELLPFCLFIAFFPGVKFGRRMAMLAAFAVGGIIASLPTIWIWMQSPANAYFGNFQYPALNTRFHFTNDRDFHSRYSLAQRLFFFVVKLGEFPGNGILTGAFVYLLIVALRRCGVRSPVGWRLAAIATIFLSQVAGGLVPAPPFLQYFYAATPWMALAVVICLDAVPDFRANVPLHWGLIVGLAITFVFSIPEYRGLLRLPFPDRWVTTVRQNQGFELAAVAGKGKVLTLEPMIPLEGGADIYEQLSTGRFAIRVGDFLTPRQRAKYHMIGAGDIPAIFTDDPPAAFLWSGDDDGSGLENNIAAIAERHGYKRHNLSDDYIAWTAPR